jgi:hypothetical protein
MVCDDVRASVSSLGDVRPDILIGKQDLFVRITSSGTVYDSGTQILQSSVNVENMLKQMIGTADGISASGVKIFFHTGPSVTSGSGTITLANADGTGSFTGGGQPYFNYPQMLDSYEISNDKVWQFNVPATVSTFSFTVLVSTAVADESASYIDRLWTGSAGTSWSNASNWQGGVPADTSTVAVPPASMITSGNQPVLDGDVTVRNFRVAQGSSINLSGFTMTVAGNVDAPGSMTNGVVSVTGAKAVIGGTFDRVVISGAARLQRPTTTSGAVAITGSLTLGDKPLNIAIQ